MVISHSIGGFYMYNPMVFLSCVENNFDQSRFKDFSILSGLGTVKLTDQQFQLLEPKPKATEIMYITQDIFRRMVEILPKKKVTGTNNEFIVKGDIIIANTIPSPNIEFVIEPDDSTKIVGRVITFPRDTIVEIMNTSKECKQKETDMGIKAIYQIGVIEIRMFDSNTGLENSDHRLRVGLQMASDLELIFSPMLISSTKIFYEYMEQIHPEGVLDEVYNIVVQIFTSWYATQTALLNPIIAGRFKRETVPYDIKPTKKGKKPPKRYIKRLTLEDISDLEFGIEKKPHQITEPLWWVSGHWRNQATKEGHKKIFIQGYWKGVLRDTPDSIQTEPRERELILDNKTSNFYY